MIDYQLKPCCNECDYLNLKYKREEIDWDMEMGIYVKTTIFCDHQFVCGKYNEDSKSHGSER